MSTHTHSSADALPPVPRRSDATRAQLLFQAQRAFAALGYRQAGLRDIAQAAQVDAALLVRYFGSKESLFSAALEGALDISPLIPADRAAFGQQVLQVLEVDETVHPNSLSMMLLAMAEPGVRETVQQLLVERVIRPLAAWLGGQAADARATRVTMLCSGYLTYRKLLPLLRNGDPQLMETQTWLVRSLQAIVDDGNA